MRDVPIGWSALRAIGGGLESDPAMTPGTGRSGGPVAAGLTGSAEAKSQGPQVQGH